jgi:iron complex outermembrane recepter protein
MKPSAGMRRIALSLGVGLLLALSWGSARVCAQSVYTLHIESQPLDSALQEFARQTGMQILFYSHLTDGRRSAALDGKYTMDAAIAALLLDSKLTYRRVNAKTIEIVREKTWP